MTDISAPGVKQTAGKAPIGLLFDLPHALEAVAKVLEFGMSKGYPRAGYLTVNKGPDLYLDAMLRHTLAETKQVADSESGLLHAAHAACDALIRLELILREGSK